MLWNLPYGDSIQGIFGATPVELLHQFGLGLEKKAFDHTWDCVAEAAEIRGSRFDGPKQQLDARFADFNVRHADTEMPRNAFYGGTYELPYLMSKEYTALMYQVNVRFYM